METNMNTEISQELEESAQNLIRAALEFWKLHQKLGGPRAVVWLEDTSGHFVVFTRSEYKRQLLENIRPLSTESPLRNPFML